MAQLEPDRAPSTIDPGETIATRPLAFFTKAESDLIRSLDRASEVQKLHSAHGVFRGNLDL
jgi:hypothetical protein